jgi:hypothetical protein
VEIKLRREEKATLVPLSQAAAHVAATVRSALAELEE